MGVALFLVGIPLAAFFVLIVVFEGAGYLAPISLVFPFVGIYLQQGPVQRLFETFARDESFELSDWQRDTSARFRAQTAIYSRTGFREAIRVADLGGHNP